MAHTHVALDIPPIIDCDWVGAVLSFRVFTGEVG